jgi:RNA polymerase sigma factor (sigma-70 family)
VNNTIGNNPADKDLIDRILHGDKRAFGIIIKNTEGLVAQIIFRMISNTEDRKDLAQDIYLKVFHNLSGFKFQSKLSTWIAQIAYNTCLSWLEKKKKFLSGNLNAGDLQQRSTEIHNDNSFESEYMISKKEISVILAKEIGNLPASYQALITLFHHESMSYEELSQITGLPEGTVKSSLFRARRMLKEFLLSKYKKEAL